MNVNQVTVSGLVYEQPSRSETERALPVAEFVLSTATGDFTVHTRGELARRACVGLRSVEPVEVVVVGRLARRGDFETYIEAQHLFVAGAK